MIIKDKLYGTFDIDGVLEEVINTDAIQRLKKIYQGGPSVLMNKSWDVTRYEHSVGTMLLIRILGGSVEEQIAGLIHDISHTAFSHVVDLVMGNNDEDYHELVFDKVVSESNLEEVLSKHGYKIDEILDEERWTILEKKAPKLCADRVDYTLRDLYHYGKVSSEEIEKLIKNLDVVDGEIVITSIELGEWFVETYCKEVIEYLGNPLNIFAYDRLSKAIKIAMEKGDISEEDLLKDDNYLMEILKNSKDDKIISLVEELNEDVKLIEDKEDYEIYRKIKMRVVDPTVIVSGKAISVSKVSEKAKKIISDMIDKLNDGIYLKVKY